MMTITMYGGLPPYIGWRAEIRLDWPVAEVRGDIFVHQSYTGSTLFNTKRYICTNNKKETYERMRVYDSGAV